MLAAAAQTTQVLTFVNNLEQDVAVPMATIADRALEVAAALRHLGVRTGDRVALVLPTSPDFVQCFFGTLLAGAIPVALYPPVRLGKLDEYDHKTAVMLRSVEAAVVVTNGRIRRLLGAAVQLAGPRLGCVTVSSLDGAAPVEPAVLDPGDIAFIQFSSGSTNDPKPVALSHANLVANLATMEDYLFPDGDFSDAVGVTWLPLYHDMGLIGNLLLAFDIAAHLVLLPPELFLGDPAVWLRAISRHRATVTAAPNFAFGLCLKRIADGDLDGVDLSSWRHCLNGAEAVNAAAQREFAEHFARWGFDDVALTPVYGLAEASLGVAFKPAGRPSTIVGVDGDVLALDRVVEPGTQEIVSVGRALAGVEIEIRDEAGAPLGADNVGRVHVRGPSVMVGYFGRPDLTAQAITDGWLDTGDLGFEHDGELYLCGRFKDIVIIRGANHAPEEFEQALRGVPGVRTGCAVAVGYVPDGGYDEELALLVEVTADAPPTLAADVSDAVEAATRIRPSHVELLDPGTLPRTSSGKLRRRESRTQWLAGTLQPPKKVSVLRLLGASAKGELLHTRAKLARRTSAGSQSTD